MKAGFAVEGYIREDGSIRPLEHYDDTELRAKIQTNTDNIDNIDSRVEALENGVDGAIYKIELTKDGTDFIWEGWSDMDAAQKKEAVQEILDKAGGWLKLADSDGVPSAPIKSDIWVYTTSVIEREVGHLTVWSIAAVPGEDHMFVLTLRLTVGSVYMETTCKAVIVGESVVSVCEVPSLFDEEDRHISVFLNSLVQ